jgi:hypothetical protein
MGPLNALLLQPPTLKVNNAQDGIDGPVPGAVWTLRPMTKWTPELKKE